MTADQIARRVIDLVLHPDDRKQRAIRLECFGGDHKPLREAWCVAYGLLRMRMT